MKASVKGLFANLLPSLATAVVLTLVVVGLEALLRLSSSDYLTALGRDDLNYLNVYSETYGWAPRPGFTLHRAGVTTTINRLGYRGREYPLARTPGRTRTVMLGDSVAFGYGVDDAATFSAVLERMEPRLEVLNLGVQGYGTDQELIKLEEERLRYHPEVVVLNACLDNDFLDNARSVNFGYPKPYFRWEQGQLRKHDAHVRLSLLERTGLFLREKSVLFNRAATLLPGRPARVESRLVKRPRDPALTARLVARVAEAARQNGSACLVLLYQAEAGFLDESWHREDRLLDADELRGLSPVSMEERFRAESVRPENLGEFLMDATGHLTAKGHWISAKIIREELARRGFPPPAAP